MSGAGLDRRESRGRGPGRRTSLFIVTEAYYPDEVGVPFYLRHLAEGLAGEFRVRVLCGFPIYDGRGAPAPTVETRGGVGIRRIRGTVFDKHKLLLRIVNLATISVSIFFRAAREIRRGDAVIVTTSPPLLPFTVKAACALKGAACILRVDDVYPEALIAARMLPERSPLAAGLRALNGWLYRRVDAVVAVGRDMAELVVTRAGRRPRRLEVIPNWADVDVVGPAPKADNELLRTLGARETFVVLCAGNMGRAQAVETMFGAAERLKENPGIRFLFIGSGAKRPWMEREARARGLTRVTILDQRPRAEQSVFLNAGDVSMVSLMPGMTGAGVPSRLYNIMAAGKAVIAVAPPESEVCRVVREEGIGWIVDPDRPDLLAEAVLAAARDPAALAAMGRRARAAAVGRYSRPAIIGRYRGLVERFLE